MNIQPKIKDRIQKLLQLSLSDNPNESSLALKKAVELMNHHNISKEDVMAQPLITESFSSTYINPPEWVRTLINGIAHSSGCFFVWKDGYTLHTSKTYATISITGRERDVKNVVYVIEVMLNIVKKKIAEHREKYTGSSNIDAIMQGYRKGLVLGVCEKLQTSQKEFFNSHLTGKELVPVDTKLKDARDFYEADHKVTTHKSSSSSLMDSYMLTQGYMDGQDISIHQAVCSSDEKRLLK